MLPQTLFEVSVVIPIAKEVLTLKWITLSKSGFIRGPSHHPIEDCAVFVVVEGTKHLVRQK